jgi:glycosyltransferase involved in cell wall biosynthesis
MTIGIDCYHIKDQKGIERYILNLLSFWKEEKDINFILYVDGNKSAKKIPKSKNFGVKVLKGLISSTTLFQHWLLPRQAKKDKINILFSPSYLLPFFYRGKTAVTIHDIIYEAHPEWFRFRGIQDKALIKWIGYKSAKKADIIFTPSEFTKQEINRFYKIKLRKIILTPLAADEIFQKKKNEDKLKKIKQKYGIKKKYFLFAAAIFERRYITETILAFQEIAKKYLDFQYLIIGKDLTSSQNISALIEKANSKLKRQAVVYRPSFVENEELATLYHGAHTLIYLSAYEGFGLPVLEGQACAIPVITSDGTSLREITKAKDEKLNNSYSALLIDSNNIQEIAEAMRRIIDDKELRKKLIKKGLKNVKRFSWKKCAEETLEALKIQIANHK